MNAPSEKAQLVEAYQVARFSVTEMLRAWRKLSNLMLTDSDRRDYYKVMARKAAAELNWQQEESVC